MSEDQNKPVGPHGWGFPYAAKKAHYFEPGNITSMCGKWMFTGPRVDELHDHPDNCVVCMRLREATERLRDARRIRDEETAA